MSKRPVAVIELGVDDDGGWLLVMPHVTGGDDLDVLDSLGDMVAPLASVKTERGSMRLPVYVVDGRGYVTWDDALPAL